VTHAIVLIEAERAAMPALGGALADVEGVAEAWSVTGEWASGGHISFLSRRVGVYPLCRVPG